MLTANGIELRHYQRRRRLCSWLLLAASYLYLGTDELDSGDVGVDHCGEGGAEDVGVEDSDGGVGEGGEGVGEVYGGGGFADAAWVWSV